LVIDRIEAHASDLAASNDGIQITFEFYRARSAYGVAIDQ